jgi:hypothetical protein
VPKPDDSKFSARYAWSPTLEVVQQALATVPTQKVLTWCQQTLGQSVQGKRKKALLAAVKTEQKWDQFRAVG